jgi:hypothetical protein
MPTFNIPINPLLDSFQKIYKELEGSALTDEAINTCEDSINTVTQFFQSKDNEAILLSLLLQLHFNGAMISMGQILEHVDLPTSAATTKAIWKSKFPGMNQQIIDALSEEFSLSGAQIENIRKKTEVDLILNEEISHDLAYFKRLAREELRLQKNTDTVQRSIGFVKRSD